MNKKGQVLVAFILILPILILFMMMLYDIGNIGFTKKHAKSEIRDVITYGLNNIDKIDSDSLENLLKGKIKNIRKNHIDILENKINIELIIEVDSDFKNIFLKEMYLITLKYTGVKEENIIIKEW